MLLLLVLIGGLEAHEDDGDRAPPTGGRPPGLLVVGLLSSVADIGDESGKSSVARNGQDEDCHHSSTNYCLRHARSQRQRLPG